MAVIRLLEKTYMLMSVAVIEYHLGGNVEFPGEEWKNQGKGLVLSAKTYIPNSKIQSSFKKTLILSLHMSEGCYPEVNDSPLCTKDDSDKHHPELDDSPLCTEDDCAI
jgi:hypothetical protein